MGKIRVGVWALALGLWTGVAMAQVQNVGTYTPATLNKVGGNGAKAVLLHAVAGFCSKCQEQRARLAELYPMYPGVERHVVAMDVAMEVWTGDKTLAGFGITEPGQLVLVRGARVLGFVDTANPEDLAALLDAVFLEPDWAPVVPPAPPLPSNP